MSIPVTTRLHESVVSAVDSAVAAGLAPTRGSVISEAVSEWLARHSEDAIELSYRKRYGQTAPQDDEALLDAFLQLSATACLANDEL